MPTTEPNANPFGQFRYPEPFSFAVVGRDPVGYSTRINVHVPDGYDPRSSRKKNAGRGGRAGIVNAPKGGPQVKVWQTKTKQTAAYQRLIRVQAVAAFGSRPTLKLPFQVVVKAFFARPQSWPKWKHYLCDRGMIGHTVKPDLDNIHKGVIDVLRPADEADRIIADDSALCRWSDESGKFYAAAGELGRLEVTIVPLPMYQAQIETCPAWLKDVLAGDAAAERAARKAEEDKARAERRAAAEAKRIAQQVLEL